MGMGPIALNPARYILMCMKVYGSVLTHGKMIDTLGGCNNFCARYPDSPVCRDHVTVQESTDTASAASVASVQLKFKDWVPPEKYNDLIHKHDNALEDLERHTKFL